MAWISARLDRLRRIVAECIQRGVTPQTTGFADHVLRISASQAISPKTARTYVRTLIDAWGYNRWRSYIKYNDYIPKEEQDQWIEKLSKKQ